MSTVRPTRGEIWFVNLDPTIGREQAKKRPCLVISNTLFNQGPADLIIVVPLTSKNKNNPLHIAVHPPEGGLVTPSFILCEQIRSISIIRFSGHPLGSIYTSTIQAVEYTLKVLLDFDNEIRDR